MRQVLFGIADTSDTWTIGSVGLLLTFEDDQSWDQHIKGVDSDVDSVIEKYALDEHCECSFDYLGTLPLESLKEALIAEGWKYNPSLDEWA